MHNQERKRVYDRFLMLPGAVLPETIGDKIPVPETLAREIRSHLPEGANAFEYGTWCEVVRRGYVRRDQADEVIPMVEDYFQDNGYWDSFLRLLSNRGLNWKAVKRVSQLPVKSRSIDLQLASGFPYYAFDRPLMPSLHCDLDDII